MEYAASMSDVTENTYFLIMGSDDIACDGLIDYYRNFKGDYTGLIDFYFYSVISKEFIRWNGHLPNARKFGYPIGSGKLVRYDVLKKCGFRPFVEDKNRSLDDGVHESYLRAGANYEAITLSKEGLMCLDIKDGQNMNQLKLWANSERLKVHEYKERYPSVFQYIL